MLACAVLLLPILGACEDSPTEPGVFTHAAEGRLWAAFALPTGLPTPRTWIPYLGAETDSVLPRVRALQAESERLRRSGDIDGSTAREAEAAILAVRSLGDTPPPHVVGAVQRALGEWEARARTVAASGTYPEAEAGLVSVHGHRTEASALLAAGDTAAALVHLTEAVTTVRSLAPDAVASRVAALAEARLAALGEGDEDAVRALRLLRNAREALAAGDELRAFRRAMYALQLAEGRGLLEPAGVPAGHDDD
jgi:hypothetical protein